MMGWMKKIKKKISATDTIERNHISPVEMVRIFPNRKADKSGVKPGAKKLKKIPSAIPSVQNTAMAESSRISCRLLSHSTPNADNTEKTAAASIGEIPV